MLVTFWHPSVHHKTESHTDPSQLAVVGYSCNVRLSLAGCLWQSKHPSGTALTWEFKGASQLLHNAGIFCGVEGSMVEILPKILTEEGLQSRALISWASSRSSRQLHRQCLPLSPRDKCLLFSTKHKKRNKVLKHEAPAQAANLERIELHKCTLLMLNIFLLSMLLSCSEL